MHGATMKFILGSNWNFRLTVTKGLKLNQMKPIEKLSMCGLVYVLS